MIAPPSDDPEAFIPNANDLRFLNHCEVMVGMGAKTIPHDNPVRKPWQRSNCQNSLHSAVITVATTRITLAVVGRCSLCKIEGHITDLEINKVRLK